MEGLKAVLLDSLKAYSVAIRDKIKEIDEHLLEGDEHILLPDPHGVTIEDIGLQNLVGKKLSGDEPDLEDGLALVGGRSADTFIRKEFAKKTLIRKPVPEGSVNDVEVTQLKALLAGPQYKHKYGVPRSYREFMIKEAGQEWSQARRFIPNTHDLHVDVEMTKSYVWRYRDISIDQTPSLWSEEATFSVADIYIENPTISNSSSQSATTLDTVFTTNNLTMSAGSDNHVKTIWTIRQNDTVIFTDENPSNKLSLSIDPTLFSPNEEYTLYVTHVGEQWGESGTSTYTFTVINAYVVTPSVTVTN